MTNLKINFIKIKHRTNNIKFKLDLFKNNLY